MKRIRWWLHCWLVLYLVSHEITSSSCGNDHNNGRGNLAKGKICKDDTNPNVCKDSCKKEFSDTKRCMEEVESNLKQRRCSSSIKAIECLEKHLERSKMSEPITTKNSVAFRYKHKGSFKGLNISANKNTVSTDKAVTNCKVSVQLPKDLDVGTDDAVVFCMLTWTTESGATWGELLDDTLVGVSVGGKDISGLQEHVNITLNLSMDINETTNLTCVFLNFSTMEYSSNGCNTVWNPGQGYVTCSCDHLTYFGVLMVSGTLSIKDQEILAYISLIGCGVSLFALVLTVLLFITNRKVRTDVSMKVHINLAIALMLLNVHFLPSHSVAAMSSMGLCLYMALALHYSLMATFSWMALEGFHLYLLLVKVFNIYVRRYLLKLSLVGWGVPAIIICLVVIIDRDAYGSVSLDSSNPNSTAICYIRNNTVKMVTTVGVFSLVFLFNVVMLAVTIRQVMSLRHGQENEQRDWDRVKRDICSLLGVTILLGITWGLVFFSFGYLTPVGLYPFCILNSLQGFFIFLWFVMSLRKIRNSAERSSDTRSTNS